LPKNAPLPLGCPFPPNEEERLQEILAYQFSDAGPEASLDQICLLAQSLFHVPTALITLVGRDRQTFLAKCGLNADGTSREDAFCSYTILSDKILVVPDATRDHRFADNPLVTGDMHIRFYAGAPLTTRPGVRIGSFCLLDWEPRQFSEADVARLQMLTRIVVNEIQRRRSMIDLRRQEDLLSQTARMTKVGSWSLHARRLVWSAETYRIFEVDPHIVPTWDLMRSFWTKECSARMTAQIEALTERGVALDCEAEIVTFTGARRWVRCIAEREATAGDIVRINGSFQDITQQREHAAEIERLAFQDSLTGLPNRALFQRRLAAAVEEARKKNVKVGLIVLDLDHFKDVNETLGHDAGDMLLRSVAERLLSIYCKTDTVARLGGDEFAVILPNIGGLNDLTGPMEHLLEILRNPQGDEDLPIAASAGLALYSEHDHSATQLLKNAEIALYNSKSAGRNRFTAFMPGMREEVEQRIALLREVRAGIEANAFILYYQPFVSIAAPRKITGFEALMRWDHPTRGVLTPDKFLAAFEDQELSVALGDVALESAMAQMRLWLDQNIAFGRVAVNLSAAQFRRGDLAQSIAHKLEKWRIPTERLTLEVTENVYMGWGSEVVGDTIRALHDTGILIALDDFGTGYASLTNLKQFPIDRLKIDKSFIHDMHDPSIVMAVLMLGESMGMKVIAEGIEDKRQLEQLSIMGRDQAQGYYFAKPMPGSQVVAFLKTFAAAQRPKGHAA
jgi:diguanylate cyclase (GGDEF)-like protein